MKNVKYAKLFEIMFVKDIFSDPDISCDMIFLNVKKYITDTACLEKLLFVLMHEIQRFSRKQQKSSL